LADDVSNQNFAKSHPIASGQLADFEALEFESGKNSKL
jgi:hypothetical protein